MVRYRLCIPTNLYASVEVEGDEETQDTLDHAVALARRDLSAYVEDGWGANGFPARVNADSGSLGSLTDAVFYLENGNAETIAIEVMDIETSGNG